MHQPDYIDPRSRLLDLDFSQCSLFSEESEAGADPHVVPQQHLLLFHEKSETTSSCKLWKTEDRQVLGPKMIDT